VERGGGSEQIALAQYKLKCNSIFTDIPATGAFLSEVNQTQITQIAAIIAKEPKVPRVIMVDRIVEIKPADRWVDISGTD